MAVPLIGKLATAVLSNSNTETGKTVGIISGIVSFVSFFGIGITLIILLVMLTIPVIMLLDGGDGGLSSTDYFGYYNQVIDIEIPNANKAYIENVKTKEKADIVEVFDYTYMPVGMLVAIDSVRYEQEVDNINPTTIKELAEQLTYRSYVTSSDSKTSTTNYLVSNDDGTMKIFDKVTGETWLEHYQYMYPDGRTSTSGARIIYVVEKVTVTKKIVVDLFTASFAEALDILKFDDDQKELAMSYFTTVSESMGEFSGEAGNYLILSNSKDFTVPVDVDYTKSDSQFVRVTSVYGYREYMLKGKLKKGFHHGIDLGLPVGTPLVASNDGIISVVANQPSGYGNWLEIKHTGGYSTRYGHNNLVLVKQGDIVKRGDIVAYSGNTGRSTGPHLHFEIRFNNAPIDPLPFLNVASVGK